MGLRNRPGQGHLSSARAEPSCFLWATLSTWLPCSRAPSTFCLREEEGETLLHSLPASHPRETVTAAPTSHTTPGERDGLLGSRAQRWNRPCDCCCDPRAGQYREKGDGQTCVDSVAAVRPSMTSCQHSSREPQFRSRGGESPAACIGLCESKQDLTMSREVRLCSTDSD